MDVLSFNAAVQAVLRADTAQRISDAWATHVAAQGTSKSMKKWVKGLIKDAGLGQGSESKNDADALIKLFKGRGL